MTTLNQTNKDLATLAGYEVFPAPGGEGFTWRVRDEKGNITGQCDAEPLSEEETWREVLQMMVEVCAEAEDFQASEWDGMTVEERKALIAQHHRDCAA